MARLSAGPARTRTGQGARRRLCRLVLAVMAGALALVSGVAPLLTARSEAHAAPVIMPAAAVSGTGTSANGKFTLTVSANKDTVAPGGETVTYTYTVLNTGAYQLYYISGADDKCAPIKMVTNSMPVMYDPYAGRNLYYIPKGREAVFTCVKNVTQSTTNTATFEFAESFGTNGGFELIFGGKSSATARVTVNVSTSSGGSTGGSSGGSGGSSGLLNCSNIWYATNDLSTDPRFAGTYPNQGTIGTIDPQTGTTKSVFRIKDFVADKKQDGSPAVAVSPENPALVYFIPRQRIPLDGGKTSYVLGPLYAYDTIAKTSRKVAEQPAGDTLGARLGVDPSGRIWSISDSARVYVLDPRASYPSWTDKGPVQFGSDVTIQGLQTGRMTSGDLAFDGNGTMYFITATSGNVSALEGYLFSISAAELARGNPRTVYIGKMGDKRYNGIAFDPEGRAYASENSLVQKLDIETGRVTQARDSGTNGTLADLASCALPKPELRVTKTVTTPRPGMIFPGETATWTVTVENIGTFPSTNTTFQDTVAGMGISSAKLNGSDVGSAYFSSPKLINSPGATQGIIKPGESATITLTTAVPSGTTERRVCNQGSVTLTGVDSAVLSDDPSLPDGADSTCVQILQPAVAVTKSGTNQCLSSDGTPAPVRATYTVTNPGNDPLGNVTVSDTACGTPVYASGDTDGDNYLDPGETWTFTCEGSATRPGTSTATARARGRYSAREVTGTGSWTLYSPVLQAAKTSSAGGEAVAQGQELTYTVTVTNTGNKDAADVHVEDAMPAGVTFVPGSITRTYRASTGVTRPVPGTVPYSPAVLVARSERLPLTAGESMIITLRARVKDPLDPAITAITNAVTVSFADNCVTRANVTDQVARFAVRKRAYPSGEAGGTGDPVEVGSDRSVSLRYIIQVDNTGQAGGKHPAITDTMSVPAGFSITGVTFTRGNTGTGTVVAVTSPRDGVYTIPASLAVIMPGGHLRYTVQVDLTANALPGVDWAKARTCSTGGAGDAAAGGAFNTVTMPGDGDGADNNDACVPLIPARQSITLQKQSLDCPGTSACTLPGAQFALYDGDPANGGTLVTSGITADTPGGARFTATGIERMRDYWLVETKAPAGHELLAQPVRFSVTFTGITLGDGASDMVKLKPGDPYTILVSDASRLRLPFAGGDGSRLPIGFGIVLAVTGTCYLLTSAWRNRRGRPSTS